MSKFVETDYFFLVEAFTIFFEKVMAAVNDVNGVAHKEWLNFKSKLTDKEFSTSQLFAYANALKIDPLPLQPSQIKGILSNAPLQYQRKFSKPDQQGLDSLNTVEYKRKISEQNINQPLNQGSPFQTQQQQDQASTTSANQTQTITTTQTSSKEQSPNKPVTDFTTTTKGVQFYVSPPPNQHQSIQNQISFQQAQPLNQLSPQQATNATTQQQQTPQKPSVTINLQQDQADQQDRGQQRFQRNAKKKETRKLSLEKNQVKIDLTKVDDDPFKHLDQMQKLPGQQGQKLTIPQSSGQQQPTSPIAKRVQGFEFSQQGIDLQKQGSMNQGFEQRKFDLLELINERIEKFKKNSIRLDLIYNRSYQTETNTHKEQSIQLNSFGQAADATKQNPGTQGPQQQNTYTMKGYSIFAKRQNYEPQNFMPAVQKVFENFGTQGAQGLGMQGKKFVI